MLALIHDPGSPDGLRLAEVPDPLPSPAQAVIDVHATSVNFGEVNFMAERQAPGFIAGNDSAGVVVEAAADGTGPQAGTRVACFGRSGGWAHRQAVDTEQMAALPDEIDFAAAAAVPAAGLTALRSLRGLGAVVGRRILVTGASGGVGRYAVQLGAQAGAHVVAAVGRPERGEGLSELGAAEIVVGLDEVEPVFGVLDTVGGALLAQAFGLLEGGGLLQSIGVASLEPSVIDFEVQRLRVSGTRIEAFGVGSHPAAEDLGDLLELLRQGRLDPQIGWRGDWQRVHEAVQALRARNVNGKAVLDVRAGDAGDR